ncbi:hypothetical protein OHA25_13750 [Nonomuraea sp. NBC_00507]|uniref:hypothetical protein n=1 Tax=Nonomuraea sp. NBC_00507 TaxID=2976002 RepID=UPI002E174555
MPTPKGILAGLMLGSAITGGTLALCATAASADVPNNNGHVLSRAVEQSAANFGLQDAEETAEVIEQQVKQVAANLGLLDAEVIEQRVEQVAANFGLQDAE